MRMSLQKETSMLSIYVWFSSSQLVRISSSSFISSFILSGRTACI